MDCKYYFRASGKLIMTLPICPLNVLITDTHEVRLIVR
jgi:hypothetical protein